MDWQTITLWVMGILMAVVFAAIGWIMGGIRTTLRDMSQQLKELNDTLLTEYVTKHEWELLRKRVHDITTGDFSRMQLAIFRIEAQLESMKTNRG